MSGYTISESHDLQVQLLLAHFPVVVFVTDRGDSIIRAEGQGLKNLGVTAHDLVGRAVADVCHAFFPQDAQHILEDIHRALLGETFRVSGTAGHVVYDLWYSPLRDEQGTITGVMGIALDVTERVRVEQELRDARRKLAERQALERFQPPEKHFAYDDRNVPQPQHNGLPKLTEREMSIVCLVVTGETNQEIANHLIVSPRTVRYGLQSIYQKLEVSSRAEAVARIMALGLHKMR